MNQRVRYITAAAAAVMAGLLTLFYLGGRSAAGGAETEIIWVARETIPPGTQLDESLLQRVRVDGPTLQLLTPDALPATAPELVGQYYASGLIEPGQPIILGRNASPAPLPALGDGGAPTDLRIVTLEGEMLAPGLPLPGEAVDIYVVPAKGAQAIRILSQAPVVQVDGDLIGLLVPESQVAQLLTATDGIPVKVVRRLPGMAP